MQETAFKLEFLDIVAFLVYFILLSIIGYWAGRKKNTDAADYFLAGQSLPWYVVGSSYIAANISTEHFIGLIGAAVIYGICVATGEWSTVIAFTFMIWIFIPFLLSSKVYTAPEFLERRFNPQLRLIFAIVSVLANIFAFMGPVIYGGSLILTELFGVNKILAPIIIGILSGVWAIWGGLKSIAFMDMLTIIIMVFGGLSVTYLGLLHLGEGAGIIEGAKKMVTVNQGGLPWAQEWINNNVSNILKGAQAGDEYNRLSVVQPLNHYSNPWTHWVFSFFYIGLWYTVINQHMIQKVFAAKNLYHARMGMVFASFLKLLLPFIVVVPGLIYFAMQPDFLSGSAWNVMSDEANKTYIVMIDQLIPVFLGGILLAALFGAIQSTVSSVLNSTSTIFTIDIYKEYINKNSTQEVTIGRIAGIVILLLSIGLAVLLATVTKVNLFIFIQALYTFIAPPFSAIFLLGMLWKRVSGRDALITVILSFVLSCLLKYLEFGLLAESDSYFAGLIKPFANQGLITWVFAMLVCTISALVTAPPAPENVSQDLTFDLKNKHLGGGLGKGLSSVSLWWAISFVLMIALVIIFSIIL
ncbi:MAG: sodium/solute symporter [Bacteroidota bacterium]